MCYLNALKSLNMAAPLHQIHNNTIKANCLWILSDITETILNYLLIPKNYM